MNNNFTTEKRAIIGKTDEGIYYSKTDSGSLPLFLDKEEGERLYIESLEQNMIDAAQLHLETILELQRIQSMVHPVDDPVTRSIGVALSELEEKFHKIHNEWSE